MKKLLVTITAMLVCVGAYGQGKLAFANGNEHEGHLIYFTTDTTKLFPQDRNTVVDGFPLAGSGLYTGLALDNNVPGTIMSLWNSPTFVAALYGGTSANSLSLQTTTTIDNWLSEGNMVPVNMIFGYNTPTPLPGGTPAYFQIQVFDSRANAFSPVINGVGGGATDAWAHWYAGEYAGESPIFQATPAPSTFNPIYQSSPPVNSTWAAGTFELVDYPGAYGAIEVYTGIPEPGIFALVGLGAAGLVTFRRRR
jgi:hypothetical protein